MHLYKEKKIYKKNDNYHLKKKEKLGHLPFKSRTEIALLTVCALKVNGKRPKPRVSGKFLYIDIDNFLHCLV